MVRSQPIDWKNELKDISIELLASFGLLGHESLNSTILFFLLFSLLYFLWQINKLKLLSITLINFKDSNDDNPFFESQNLVSCYENLTFTAQS